MSAVHNNIRNWRKQFEQLSANLEVDLAALHAVAAVEVGTLPPPPIGLPVIRFEVHSFLRRTKKDASSRIQLRDAPTAWHKDAHWYKSSSSESWERVHSGDQSDEWGALVAASAFDPETALECASWGIGQLMGWHYDTCRYASVHDFVSDAVRGPSIQFQQWGYFLTFEQGGVLLESIVEKDWYRFARVYNGPGQPEWYARKIEENYEVAEAALVSSSVSGVFDMANLETWRGRQECLVDLGYDPGPVDGKFGAKTKFALKQFQADVGLTPDGLWGPKTEYEMHKASS